MRNLAAFIVAILLSGCSVNLKVEHINQANFASSLSNPGVYYTLPKTQIKITVPLRLNKSSSSHWDLLYNKGGRKGQKTSNVEDIREFCEANDSSLGILSKNTATVKSTLFLGQASLETESVADPSHIYKLKAKFSHFANFSHTLDLGANGIIKSANSQLTNTSVTAAQFGLDLASRIAGLGAGDPRLALLAGSNFSQNECHEYMRGTQRLAKLRAELTAMETAKSSQLKSILASPSKKAGQVELDVLKQGIAAHDAGISAVKSKIAKVPNIGQFLGSNSNTYYSYLGVYEPNAAGATAQLRQRISQINKPENDLTSPKLASVKSHPHVGGGPINSALISPLITVDVSKVGLAAVPGAVPLNEKGMGYRYRIPGQGLVKIEVKNSVSLEKTLDIAQFGHIAHLPGKINGLKADIQPTFDPATGALTKIVLGATPLEPDSILSTFNSANDLRRGSRGTPEEEKSELDKLKDDNALLEAMKTNRELRQTLGLQ